MERAKTQQSHPRMEELSSCVVQHRDPYTSPGTPTHLPGNNPQPAGSQRSKTGWHLGLQPLHQSEGLQIQSGLVHPGLVSGELLSSCCVSYIIVLIGGFYTQFLLLVKKTPKQSFPRAFWQWRAVYILQKAMKTRRNSRCTVKNRFTGMSLVTAVSSNTENTELVHSHGRTRKFSGL